MITEDFVTHEVARLLEKKGFDGECRNYIDGNSTYKSGYYVEKPITSNKLKSGETLLPTLQMACKWLRLKHHLYIELMAIKNYDKKKIEYTYTIQDLNFPGSDDGIDSCKNWDTPEEAVGEAIKDCLENLI